MGEWQPIETAPKDGTPVDIWTVECSAPLFRPKNGQRSADCRWRNDSHTGDGWYTDYRVDSPFTGGARIATHWMPLPEPPSVTP